MKFIVINLSEWERTEVFNHFLAQKTSFSMTNEMDITNLYHYLKEQDHSFYPGFIYLLTTIANQDSHYRMSFDEKGRLGYWDKLVPLYTIFAEETHQFSTLSTDFSADFNTFKQNYLTDVAAFSATGKLFPQPSVPENVLSISMIPWVSFTGFNLNVTNGTPYLLPIVTGGKFIFRNERVFLPVSLQVHHAVCDGFHAANFLNQFGEMSAAPWKYFQ
ncbi:MULTISPECIES: type A chloramphenicol O-acetyltransferase [Enterococcus]|uniref:Chloramphenicol acetyltransferase n=1 Tax=Candidatus Enterococcus murrayae TaxID=2815321 RepID=A0ABS3HHE5_9ENTE|nr:type A chloramphenicol O-acetyltransferase [Enterococcus sp. MJM16]MBO0452678.1 type A chloramphenicol O-acetyltransferase [Enterococcus sp. MJM16]